MIQKPNSVGYANATRKIVWRERMIYFEQLEIAKETLDPFEKIQLEESSALKVLKNGDSYFSVNGFSKKRSAENVVSLNAIFVDLDVAEKNISKAEATKILTNENYFGLPTPSLIFDSGRGLHLYWVFDRFFSPKQFLDSYMLTLDYFTEVLASVGADKKCVDVARLMRIPCSFNTRSQTWGKVILDSSIKYNLIELYNNYIKPLQQPKSKKEHISSKKDSMLHQKEHTEAEKRVYNTNFTYKTLNLARIDDYIKLVQMRNFNVEGCRNELLFFFAVAVRTLSLSTYKVSVHDLNRSFNKPLRDREVENILKSVEGYYAEGGRRFYKNSTIIKKLNITSKEERSLKTIISTAEKYRRNNARRSREKRNSEGLTRREEQLKKRIELIQEYKKNGFTQKETAEETKLSLRTVKTYWGNGQQVLIYND